MWPFTRKSPAVEAPVVEVPVVEVIEAPAPPPTWAYVGHHYVGVVMVAHHPTHEYVVEYRRGDQTIKQTKQFHAAKLDEHDTVKLVAHFTQLASVLT